MRFCTSRHSFLHPYCHFSMDEPIGSFSPVQGALPSSSHFSPMVSYQRYRCASVEVCICTLDKLIQVCSCWKTFSWCMDIVVTLDSYLSHFFPTEHNILEYLSHIWKQTFILSALKLDTVLPDKSEHFCLYWFLVFPDQTKLSHVFHKLGKNGSQEMGHFAIPFLNICQFCCFSSIQGILIQCPMWSSNVCTLSACQALDGIGGVLLTSALSWA